MAQLFGIFRYEYCVKGSFLGRNSFNLKLTHDKAWQGMAHVPVNLCYFNIGKQLSACWGILFAFEVMQVLAFDFFMLLFASVFLKINFDYKIQFTKLLTMPATPFNSNRKHHFFMMSSCFCRFFLFISAELNNNFVANKSFSINSQQQLHLCSRWLVLSLLLPIIALC